MVFGSINKWQTARAERKVQAELEAAEYQRNYAAGQELADKIIKAVDAEFEEFADGMIAVFVKRVAIKVIFSDDPSEGSQAAIAELTQQLTDGPFDEIKLVIRTRLSDWEQFSHNQGIHSAYEKLLKDRFDGLFLKLWMRAVDSAYPIVIARKAEMGFDEKDTEALELGRRILAEARATKVSISPEQSQRLLEQLEIKNQK